MNLLPIAQRLSDHGVGTMGTTIFVNGMPQECREGVLIRNKLTGTPIDDELPGYYRSGFQVIARSKAYERGEELMDLVAKALTLRETELGLMLVRRMRPVTMPVAYPISKGNLLETTADYEIIFHA